jgi:chemotaxis protein MotB
MTKDAKKPIIVKKIIKKGGGHHGGSWKVAYADFVTAMMAFFLVMWILGMDEGTRKSVESYFQDPVGFQQGSSAGISPISVGVTPMSPPSTPVVRVVSRAEEARELQTVGERIRTKIHSSRGLGTISAQIEIVMTEEGLRIELIETDQGETFFAFGAADLKPAARLALSLIAEEMLDEEMAMVVEGHTDAVPFGSSRYSNWELSADRANAARRALEASGMDPERIKGIKGHADRYLRVPGDPLHPSNRRISILLPFASSPEIVRPGYLPTEVQGSV